MFEILYYLFENYFDSGSYPDSATLTRKLTMAGFNDEDIHQTKNIEGVMVGTRWLSKEYIDKELKRLEKR